MRTYLDGNGNDSTSAVLAHLAAHRQLEIADLFQFKTLVQGEPWSKNGLLTTAPSALTWNHVGTFVPGKLKRSTVESKIGLDVSSLDIEWYLSDADLFRDGLTMLQSFEKGLWENGRATLYRAVMPTYGDCNTFGACIMFSGRIADHSPTRTGVKLTINSLTELFDLKVPTNLIEPVNVQAEYDIGQPPVGMTEVPTFTVASGGDAGTVLATGPQLFANDTFDFGYLVFDSGTSLGKMFRTVRRSEQHQGCTRFRLYEPFPWAPAVGETFTAYVPYARSAERAAETSAMFQGFPYVPKADSSL